MLRDQPRKQHRMKDKKEKFEYGFYWDCRKECVQKFGSIMDLPIINGPGEKISESYRGGKVLDVGAGKEKPIQKYLNLSDDLYFSLDNDPCGRFDYNSVEEIPERIIHISHIHPQSEISKLKCNREKAKRLLGWEPVVDFSEGLERTRKWIEKN